MSTSFDRFPEPAPAGDLDPRWGADPEQETWGEFIYGTEADAELESIWLHASDLTAMREMIAEEARTPSMTDRPLLLVDVYTNDADDVHLETAELVGHFTVNPDRSVTEHPVEKELA